MSGSIVCRSEANIRAFGRIVRYFDAAINMSDTKVSTSTPAMRMIAPILRVFTSGMRITGTI